MSTEPTTLPLPLQPATKEPEYSIQSEKIEEQLDENNWITQCRYGSFVLNSKDTVFIDVDRPNAEEKLQQITSLIPQLIGDDQQEHMAFHTHNGYRLMFLNPPLTENLELFHEMARIGDPAYAALCKGLGFWRARISPKPHRMKGFVEAHGTWQQQDTDEKRKVWGDAYIEAACGHYAVCSQTVIEPINTYWWIETMVMRPPLHHHLVCCGHGFTSDENLGPTFTYQHNLPLA